MPRRKSTDEVVDTNIYKKDDIVEELKKNFVLYANEVNKFRAIPYNDFGNKPIAAHALWGMYKNKRTHDKPYTKSAKVVGEVMSFSPHGDSYDSLVRMAQNFVYHIPLIDGHGSFGSAIGGPQAGASRYTEMRLSEFTEDVLFYNTKLLDMGLNYLEEEEEPIINTWTALFPLLFITNTTGIGYTVANTWSSGNMYEFREQLLNYLKTGKVDCSKVFPDFPTGGVIVNKSEMANLYETGKGSIKLRGKTEIDGDTIKILSLPYGYYPENFMEDVKKFYEGGQTSIKEVSNRCGRDGFLIEVECEEGTAEYTLRRLFTKTCLQTTIADEHKAVDKEGNIRLWTLPDYIKAFVDANIELVKKEAQLNLDEINARLEIVNGLISALEIIDDIIKAIKNSKSMDDAKNTLMTKKIKGHIFTERQADAIVHTPLGRLANLEQIKLQDEKKKLEKAKAENEHLLSSYKAQEKYFLKRFDGLMDKYAWERKTELTDDAEAEKEVDVRTMRPRTLKPKKTFKIVLTEAQTLKRIDSTKFRATEEDSKNITVEGNQYVTMVTNFGNMYKVKSNDIELVMPAATGTPISDIRPELQKGEVVLAIYSEDISLPYIYFITKCGLGKKAPVDTHLKISKCIGTTVCGLKTEGDEVVAVKLLNDKENIEVTTNQRTVVVDAVGQNVQAGRNANGKVVVKLKKGEYITEVHSKE